jgi:cytochrome c biogenesis factor
MENPNNQFTPPEASEQTPFYKTTWFILLTTFCICCPVGLFLMWKYKKFHIGVRIAFTSVFSLSIVVFTALAVANAIGASSRKASSSVYPTYSMETTANDLFETEEETTTAKAYEYQTEETTPTNIEETTTSGIISETTASDTSNASMETVYEVKVDDILDAYSDDKAKADELYKGKTLRFTATVGYISADTNANRILVNFNHSNGKSIDSVACFITDSAEKAKAEKLVKGDTITIIGVGDGYFVSPTLQNCKIQ